jgi:arylsulfatase A-like enzyme
LRIVKAASTLAALPLIAMSASSITPVAERPNVVFLFSDDHAAHAISAYQQSLKYGVKLPPTPNLDRLARDGMLFVNSFVTNSICGPARATVLTGQYGHLNGVMTNNEPIHPTTVTFPKLMQGAGYQTALFGKWHLRTKPEGFDRYEILAGQGPYYNPVLHSGSDSVRYTGYTLDVVTDRALKWLNQDRDKSKPFMMMLAFNAPHRWWDPGPGQLSLYRDTTFEIPGTFWDSGEGRASPARDPEMKIALDLIPRDLKLDPPNNLSPAQLASWNAAYGPENEKLRVAGLEGDALAKWKYQRFIADYMRVISALDAQVGRVLQELDRAGLSKNTVVVYSSDQGFFLGDHGWFDKRWMYEESLRTPLIVRWPGVVKAGSRNSDLVMNLDLAETFLDIAGSAKPASMQGESIVPLLRGSTPRNWRDAIYYQYFEYPGWHAVRRQYGVRTQRYKLIRYYEAGEWELFDLDKDPEELKSVHSDRSYATVRRDLERKLAALRRQYAVPEKDPAPYYPWELPPEYRRVGSPGSTRTPDELTKLRNTGAMSRALAAASPLFNGKVIHEKAHGYAELNGIQQVADAHFEATDFQSGRWLKGNTHTHTLESDGDSPPETVAKWYKAHNYNFLVLSDHNVWVDPRKLSHLVDSTFLLIPGEELTAGFGSKPVHVNGLNIPAVIAPRTDSTLLGTVQKNVDAVREVQGVPHINHPNFGWAISQDVLSKMKNDKLIEIHNGHPLVHNEGGGDSPGMEAVWDCLLSQGKRIYGIAVDDAHHFLGEFAADRVNPGRGWVTVRASNLDARDIVTQLEAGRFYASSGVELDSVRVTAQDMMIAARKKGDFKFTIEFIGAGGVVLRKTGENPATYHLSGNESYVRGRVTDSGGAVAWLQPVFVVR